MQHERRHEQCSEEGGGSNEPLALEGGLSCWLLALITHGLARLFIACSGLPNLAAPAAQMPHRPDVHSMHAPRRY